MESKTQDLNISSRNRFYYLHKLLSFNYRKRPRKEKKKQTQKTNTKQSFTLNKLTEIFFEAKVGSTSHAYWVKPIIFGILSDWL